MHKWENQNFKLLNLLHFEAITVASYFVSDCLVPLYIQLFSFLMELCCVAVSLSHKRAEEPFDCHRTGLFWVSSFWQNRAWNCSLTNSFTTLKS